MRKNRIKLPVGDRVVGISVYAILFIVFLVSVYPFYLAIVLSFNEGLDSQLGGIYFWPRKPTLENYQQFFSDVVWIRSIGVTLLRTVVGTVLTVFFTALVSYGLSDKELIGRKVYISLFIFAMYFSGGIIPYYTVLRSIKLLDTFWVYIIPQMLNLFYVLVAITFFQGIPREIHEAARIDGANEMKIFQSIIVPISAPLLATIAIFVSVQHWNSWYDSAFFIKNNNLRTLAYQMMAVVVRSDLSHANVGAEAASALRVTPLSVQLSAMVFSVAPILCVYPFFQRFIISGIAIGSVKG